MKRALLLSLALALRFLSGMPCWGQTSTPRFELFGGYSNVPTSFSFYGGTQNGWTAALDINSKAHNWIGFATDYAQYTFHDNGFGNPLLVHHVDVWTLLFGPRFFYSRPGSKVALFANSLVGPAHIRDWLAAPPAPNSFNPPTSFGWANGGGVDYRIANHFALRGQANLLYTRFSTRDNQLRVSNWHAQISVGAVFQF